MRLTKKDYRIIESYMKDYKIEKGSGQSIVIELFLDYYKRRK